jgi:hypothetical protein
MASPGADNRRPGLEAASEAPENLDHAPSTELPRHGPGARQPARWIDGATLVNKGWRSADVSEARELRPVVWLVGPLPGLFHVRTSGDV